MVRGLRPPHILALAGRVSITSPATRSLWFVSTSAFASRRSAGAWSGYGVISRLPATWHPTDQSATDKSTDETNRRPLIGRGGPVRLGRLPDRRQLRGWLPPRKDSREAPAASRLRARCVRSLLRRARLLSMSISSRRAARVRRKDTHKRKPLRGGFTRKQGGFT
eukprot:305232-Pyramimonas_sp.AAC.1